MGNLCRTGMVSTCCASGWSCQACCDHAMKSSSRNECMHFVGQMDGRCDSIEAISAARNGDDERTA